MYYKSHGYFLKFWVICPKNIAKYCYIVNSLQDSMGQKPSKQISVELYRCCLSMTFGTASFTHSNPIISWFHHQSFLKTEVAILWIIPLSVIRAAGKDERVSTCYKGWKGKHMLQLLPYFYKCSVSTVFNTAKLNWLQRWIRKREFVVQCLVKVH